MKIRYVEMILIEKKKMSLTCTFPAVSSFLNVAKLTDRPQEQLETPNFAVIDINIEIELKVNKI